MNEPVINTSDQGPNSSGSPKGSLPRPEDDEVAYATGGVLTTQDVVDECRAVRKERALPRPEDVPEGEVWMIRLHENADPVPAFRVHASKYGPGKRWAYYRVGGSMLGFADDEDVTLVSRMVPERKGNVSLHPDKFPGEECQFMHPPECYCGG